MLQKRNDLDIVELLRRQDLHIRSIAQKLNLIPSTVMRILQQLERENVVDFTRQGRNKTYSLKKSLEAKNYLYMTECHKLLNILQNKELRRIAQEIHKQVSNELIVLFGSYAKGTQTKHSDIDIFIETQNNQLQKELQQISEKLSIIIGKLDKENPLTQEIHKHHIILQGIEQYYQENENQHIHNKTSQKPAHKTSGTKYNHHRIIQPKS